MIKAILWDADGVTIRKHRYFSERLIETCGIMPEEIVPFFKNEFVQCVLGRADLKEDLKKYMPVWNLEISIDEFLETWFSGENVKNDEVLSLVQESRKHGIKSYLVTDQEKYRAEYIWNEMGFKEYFDRAFFSHELGYRKSNKEFFERVLAEIKQQPQDVLYVDDDEKNIQVAQEEGIYAQLYTLPNDLEKKLTRLLGNP